MNRCQSRYRAILRPLLAQLWPLVNVETSFPFYVEQIDQLCSKFASRAKLQQLVFIINLGSYLCYKQMKNTPIPHFCLFTSLLSTKDLKLNKCNFRKMYKIKLIQGPISDRIGFVLQTYFTIISSPSTTNSLDLRTVSLYSSEYTFGKKKGTHKSYIQ